MTMPGVANGHQNQWNSRNNVFQYPDKNPMTPGPMAQMSPMPPMTPMAPHPHKLDGSPHHSYTNGYSSDQRSDVEEGPVFLLEHLATLRMGKEHGIVDPTDGLNRLWQMEKTNGIWTQKMKLKLEKKNIIIIDYETGDTVERFPINLISSPMAFMGNDPKELYNNILIFIVKGDVKQKGSAHSEMHIFQINKVSAQEVVDDMKLFMAGKWKQILGKSENQRPSIIGAPPEVMNGVRQPPSRFNAEKGRSSPYNPRDSIDETSSTSSEKYERDVAILNHCFDDIERFIGRLQSSAAALKELERRRRSRKSKKKDHGDGMLSMRAKPPAEKEFLDVFQKFKLSFNLLAKLKSHIHDPNAPELVHFLFTPLTLIVDASRDSNYGPNLASKVVAPLLTKEAIDLLINCLTSKESDLWHSLGDAWVVPREQWKGHVSQYHPIFSDGWSPEYPLSEERDRAEITAAAAATAAQRVRREEIYKAQLEAEMREQEYQQNQLYYDSDKSDQRPGPSPHQFSNFDRVQSPQDRRSDISADSIEHNGPLVIDTLRNLEKQQRQWLKELRAKDAKVVQVVFPRTANNDKELTVFRGEYLEVLDDSRKWWKARNFRGTVAHVPHTIVTPIEDDAAFSNQLYNSRDSPGRSTDSGSGDRILKQPIPPPPAPDWVMNKQGKRDDLKAKEIPQPPPMPIETEKPPEVPVLLPVPKPKPKPKKKENDFDEELRHTLREREKNAHLSILHTPLVYISENSTDSEVQAWLRDKGFDSDIQRRLVGKNGLGMFQLQKHEMVRVCGKEEGLRMESQLNVQKSISGYETLRGRELEQILKNRKEKSENNEPFYKSAYNQSHSNTIKDFDEFNADNISHKINGYFDFQDDVSVADNDDLSNEVGTLRYTLQQQKKLMGQKK